MLDKVLQKFAKETLKEEKVGNELNSLFPLNVLMLVKFLIIPKEDENKKLENFYAFKDMSSAIGAESSFSSEIESLLVISRLLSVTSVLTAGYR